MTLLLDKKNGSGALVTAIKLGFISYHDQTVQKAHTLHENLFKGPLDTILLGSDTLLHLLIIARNTLPLASDSPLWPHILSTLLSPTKEVDRSVREAFVNTAIVSLIHAKKITAASTLAFRYCGVANAAQSGMLARVGVLKGYIKRIASGDFEPATVLDNDNDGGKQRSLDETWVFCESVRSRHWDNDFGHRVLDALSILNM
jgi:hypothetical protein